jgi:hypothetical protein
VYRRLDVLSKALDRLRINFFCGKGKSTGELRINFFCGKVKSTGEPLMPVLGMLEVEMDIEKM